MNRSIIVIVVGVLFVGTVVAQSDKDTRANTQTPVSADAQNDEVNGSLARGSHIQAALTKAVDSKKAKQGDPVTARTTERQDHNSKWSETRGPRNTSFRSRKRRFEFLFRNSL